MAQKEMIIELRNLVGLADYEEQYMDCNAIGT